MKQHQYTHTLTAGNLPIKPSMPHSPISNQLHFTTSAKRWCSATPVRFLAVLKRLSWTQQEEASVAPIKRNTLKEEKGQSLYIKRKLLIEDWVALQITALTGNDETWRRKAMGGWKNLCTQHFLCEEYQWRTEIHRQPIKASFHSLTFPVTAAQTASLTGRRDNKKPHLKAVFYTFTVATRCENVPVTDKPLKNI